MTLWHELQEISERERYSGIFARVVNAIRVFKLRRRLNKDFFGIAQRVVFDDVPKFIPIVQHKFYEVKQTELIAENMEEVVLILKSNAEELVYRF